MSRKDRVADPITEKFELYFQGVGYSKDGKKIVMPRRRVKWHPATPKRGGTSQEPEPDDERKAG